MQVMRNDIKDKLYMVLEFCLTSLQALLDSVPEKKLPASQAHQYVLFFPIHSFGNKFCLLNSKDD
jgi:hypothetical protein